MNVIKQIDHRSLSEIIPYARNPRNNERAISTVVSSIKEFGVVQPITVDENGVIITGHTRLLAAQRLGLETFPVIVLRHLTPAQVKAYRIMDNRSNQNSEWEYEMLRLEFDDLQQADIDLSITGFEEFEISPIMRADYTPKEPEEESVDGVSFNSVRCTKEQYEVFLRAANKIRESSGDQTISEGKILELISADFLSGE